MKKLKQNLFKNIFSHIYIENKAKSYEITKDILKKFKNSHLVYINHYKDVFSRKNQDFTLQKQSPSLILAVKEDNLIYKGAEMCESFGNNNFYYTSCIMNCMYDCEYCYLQGMYSSANIVVFVNLNDIFTAVSKLLEKSHIYLCISYDTDILSFENILSYGKRWIEFANKNPNLKLEIRTKSDNFKSIQNMPVNKNVILAWTLSPSEVCTAFEHKTPSLLKRLNSAKEAILKGWKVRICFDPVLYIDNWQNLYKDLIDTVFTEIPAENIYDVSIGFFRVSKNYLKIMRKRRPYSLIINYPYATCDKICSYNYALTKKMSNFIYKLSLKYIDKEKIYL